jgi:MFS family permease
MYKRRCDAPLEMRRLRESAAAFADVFRNRNLRNLELAWAGSVVGAWAYTVAISVYAYQHGGAAAVGVIAAARWITAGIVSPFAAVLGDRYDRRWVMVSSDLLRAGLITAAAVAVAGGAPPLLVYVLSVLITVSSTPFRPAEAALTPTLSGTPEELTAANVVATTIESLGMFGGPALGGLLLAASGTVTVFVATAVCHVWSAVLVSRVRPPEVEGVREISAEEPDAGTDLLGGVRTIARESRLRLLVGLFSAQAFVDGMLNVLIVVIALKLLHDNEPAVGYLNSAVGIGGLIGAVVTAALVARKRLATDFGIGVFVWGLPIALVAVWPNLAASLLLLGIVGIGNTMVDVFGVTLMQRSAPEAVVARVFGVLESAGLIAVALGALVAPVVLALLGARTTLVLAGVLLPVLVIPSWRTLTAIDRAASIPTERISLLRAIPIFALLPEVTVERLAAELVRANAAAGNTIFRRGDEGDRFYVIEDGSVEVQVDSGAPVELGRGDFFGEIALLRDVPRTATVTARTDTSLYSLNWDAFVPAVAGHASSRRAADGVIGARLGTARAGLVRA